MQLPVAKTISPAPQRNSAGVALAVMAVTLLLAGPAQAAPPAEPIPAQGGLLRGHEQEVQKNTYGLGVSAGLFGYLGFAYRQYFGNSAVQLNILPIVYDRGDYLALHFGAQYIHYMLVWSRGRTLAFTPASTSLRLVTGAHIAVTRDDGGIDVADANCIGATCKAVEGAQAPADTFASAAAGFGLEFGGVTRSGFSASVDLLMTVMWDREGFWAASPLPYGALMYSW